MAALTDTGNSVIITGPGDGSFDGYPAVTQVIQPDDNPWAVIWQNKSAPSGIYTGLYILDDGSTEIYQDAALPEDTIYVYLHPNGTVGINAKLLDLECALKVNGNLGFFNTTPVAKPTVTGSRSDGTALASLITALASLGLITDSTTT